MAASELINKYNVPGPRYTSYPTVPYWNENTFSTNHWKTSFIRSFKESIHLEGISLYIHLPFCESLCTFCGCNKRITKNHSVEDPYINSVLKEWELYTAIFPARPVIKEIHLGGGTPTFFSPENLKRLIDGIFEKAIRAQKFEMSFEGHPNSTTKKHLEILARLGFNRVSYGVQDYNLSVQKAIHRIQPFEHVKNATDMAREAGFSSVGHDIIFGLPFQTEAHIVHTIEKTKELMPDRIAFYSYAHVPWIKGNGQRGFSDANLPKADEKRSQYETGKKMLLEAGYIEIGMDHFALVTDSLYESVVSRNVHRNFMGYTSSKTKLMIGLGVSSISDSWYGFAQNVKTVEEYQNLIDREILSVFKGYILNNEDLVIRRHILNIMCKLETSWYTRDRFFDGLPEVLISLMEMQNDGLLEIDSNCLKITEKGRPFVRNVCMAFDMRLQRNKPETQLFSMTV